MNAWTVDERAFLLTHVMIWRPERIASHLGRTEYAVRRRMYWERMAPTRQLYITSGEAARRTGYSQQWCNHLAREGKIKARRVPGGRWWLFDPKRLPRRRDADHQIPAAGGV